MIGPDLALGAVQVVTDVIVPLAHDIGAPHQETAPKDEGGGTSPFVVGGGVAATLALAGGLIWVRERSRKLEASARLEGHPDADRHQQDAGAALEPGDHARPGQEPA